MALESYKTETTDSSTEWILSMKFWKRKKIRHVDFDQREKKRKLKSILLLLRLLWFCWEIEDTNIYILALVFATR